MERYFGEPDIRHAAAIISGAKIEARKIVPGDDPESVSRRYALTSAIIEQIVERLGLNGKLKTDYEILAPAEAAL